MVTHLRSADNPFQPLAGLAIQRGTARATQAVDPVLSTFALLAIPTGILLYYFIFYLTFYVVGLIIFVLVVVAISNVRDLFFAPLAPLFGLYVWLGVTVLWTPADGASFQYAVTGVYASFAAVSGTIKARFRDGFPLQLMMLCASTFALCASFTFFELGTFIDDSKGAIRSLLGAFFLAGLPALTFFAVRYRNPFAAVALLATLVIGLQLGSRTFLLISLPAVLMTLVIVTRNSRFFRLARWPITLIAALTFAAVVLEASNFSVLSALDSVAGRGSSFAVDEATFAEARSPQLAAADLERRLLIAVGMESFDRAPFTGAGFLSTTYYVGFYYTQELSAHGLPLFLLGETGLIGVVLFLLALWTAVTGYFKHAQRLDRDRASVAYVELITLVIIIANGLFHQVYVDFYFYLFLGIGAWRLREVRLMGPQRGRAVGLSI